MPTEILGASVNLPTIDITGWLSSTWFYVVIIAFIGFILLSILLILLFYRTYSRKVIFFENISGMGYQPVQKRRARLMRVGRAGSEVMKLMGGGYMSAYGRKMGKNTYWFAKGQDGYWYNFLLADLDAKKAILDIDPVDKDVRMLHTALGELNLVNYGQAKFWEKHGNMILGFVFLIIFIIGMWFIIGKLGETTAALTDTAKTNKELTELNARYLEAAINIKAEGKDTGIVPVTDFIEDG